MSHARKHVTDSVLNQFPVPSATEVIVKCISLKGNNVAEVETPEGSKLLVTIPQKFNKVVWVSRGFFKFPHFFSFENSGDFLIIQPTLDQYKTASNQGIVTTILYKEQIKHLKTEGVWPQEFEDQIPEKPVEYLSCLFLFCQSNFPP